MNESWNRLVRQYLNDISESLVCKKSVKKYFTKELENSVSSYCAEHPDATLDDLYLEFGKPEAFAHSLCDREDYAELYGKAKKKALIWMIVSLLGILTIAALVFLVVYVIEVYGGSHITVSDTY